MSDLDLDAIEARLKATSSGPWEVEDENDVGPNDEGYWEWFQVGPARIDILGREKAERESAQADAEFIANARADIEALLAEVKRLRG